ncbi:MAG: isopentenyl-diphosphate Delta-isomerase [Clostridia bacterium]|nr:isopentenyl-diphosphate Delta-isomerase [Clostridia bacterium]
MAGDPAKDDLLLLVDGMDRVIGQATKEEVHVRGLLHRAFSLVLTRNGRGGKELLIARRAEGKYHSGGLWANSCCSHPRYGEELITAAGRRVREELGCGAANLREIGSFIYRAEFPSGLCEYEYDHILMGEMETEGEIRPDAQEVSEVKWVTGEELSRMLTQEPQLFSAWAFTVLSRSLQVLKADED